MNLIYSGKRIPILIGSFFFILTHVLGQTALPETGLDRSNTNSNNSFSQGLFVQQSGQYLFFFNEDGSAPDFVVYDLKNSQVDSIIPGNNLMVDGSMIRDTLYFAMARNNSGGVNRQVHWFAPGPANQSFQMAYGINPWIRSSSYTLVGDEVFFVGKNPNSSSASRSKLLRLGLPRDTSSLEVAADLNTGQDEIRGNNTRSDFDAGILGFGPTGTEFVLYRGSNGTSGFEYFVYNTATNSASLLLDASATGNGAFANGIADPANHLPLPVRLANGNTIFPAYSDTSDVELWISDGSMVNTQQIRNLNSNGGIGIPTTALVSMDSVAIFAANTGNGLDLWKTDGTAPQTLMISNINPAGDDMISNMAVNDTLGLVLFSANDGTSGSEPWVTDGTSAGTMMLSNINSNGASNPRNITAVNGGFIFVADNGSESRLYFTDGTSANTTQLDNRGSYTAYKEGVKFLAVSEQNVYFADTAGVVFQVALPTGPNQAPNLPDANYVILDSVSSGFLIDTLRGIDPDGNVLTYSIFSGNSLGNFELESGTGALKVAPGATFDVSIVPSYTLEVGVSDGGLTDTAILVIDMLEAFPTQPQALPFTASHIGPGDDNNQFRNALYVKRNDEYLYYFNNSNNQDFVFYDLKSLNIDSIAPARNIVGYGNMIQDTLYFCGSRNATLNQNRNVQWVVPGAGSDFYQIDYGTNPWVYGTHYRAVGNSIFFAGKIPGSSNQGKMKLLRLGPTRDLTGLSLASDLNTGNDEFIQGNFPDVYDVAVTPVGPTGAEFALYRGSDGSNGFEYFVYDLGDSTSSLLLDISSTGDGAYANGSASVLHQLPIPITLSSGLAIFPAYSDTSDVELWITDGSSNNTQQIANLNSNGGINIPRTGLVAMGDSAFFAADSGAGLDLWLTDGTSVGTKMVLDINPGGNDSIQHMATNQGMVFFSAMDSLGDVEPWISDGTASGTAKIGNINTNGSSNPHQVFAAGDGFIFVANNGAQDLIYYTDGNSLSPLDTRSTYVPYGPGQQYLAVSEQFVYFGDTTGQVYRVVIPSAIPNTAPSLADTTFELSQDASPGSSVGLLAASDPEGQSLIFSIAGGNTDNDFEIDGSTGQILVSNTATLDAVTKAQYLLEVVASDGSLSDTAIAEINVFVPNTAPVFDVNFLGPYELTENTDPGTIVDTLKGIDNENDPLAFQIVGGNDDGNFTLGNSNGVLAVAPNGIFDFDLTPSYTLSVRLSDGELSDTAEVEIRILEVVSNERLFLESVELGPNPVESELRLHVPFQGLKHFSIIDIQGKELSKGEFSENNYLLSFDGFENGIYLLKLETKFAIGTWRIQKK